MPSDLIDLAGRPAGLLSPAELQQLSVQTALSTQAANRATQVRQIVAAAIDADKLDDAELRDELLLNARVLLGLADLSETATEKRIKARAAEARGE